MPATVAILELHTVAKRPPSPATRFARVLLEDGGVRRLLGVGGIPLAGDAQAWLDARADALFARAAAAGQPYGSAEATDAKDQAKRAYDFLDWFGRALRAIAGLTVDELNILRRQVVAVGTFAWDPANLADGAGLTRADVAAAGAAFGDFAQVATPYSLQGVTVNAYVHAAGILGVRLQNETGAAVNLGSGNWSYAVWRPEAMSPRTDPQARTAVRNRIDAG